MLSWKSNKSLEINWNAENLLVSLKQLSIVDIKSRYTWNLNQYHHEKSGKITCVRLDLNTSSSPHIFDAINVIIVLQFRYVEHIFTCSMMRPSLTT